MTDEQVAELRQMVGRWESCIDYSDNYDYSTGYENGKHAAAWELEDWLRSQTGVSHDTSTTA